MSRKEKPAKPYAAFDFDLAGAVQEQLVKAFDDLPVGRLAEEILSEVRQDKGVYQLFLDGKIVYIGKADKLRSRLDRHRFRLGGRLNLDLRKMGFKCLYVHRNWTPMTHEESLIRFYQTKDASLWNGTGFGSNDPGRNREQTNQAPEGFHSTYPINASVVCEFIAEGKQPAIDILKELKANLPFLLRFPRLTDANRAALTQIVTIPKRGLPLLQILELIISALPDGWQATHFPSHAILYHETRDYTHGTVIRARKGKDRKRS